MSKLNPRHPVNATPPPRLLPLLQNIKTAYILWYRYYQALPKIHRYSLGQRTDKLFIEIMEMVSIAAFLSKQEKLPYVQAAIRKLDTLKLLLLVMWETDSLHQQKYIALSIPLDEIGKRLDGWNGQIIQQNSPPKL